MHPKQIDNYDTYYQHWGKYEKTLMDWLYVHAAIDLIQFYDKKKTAYFLSFLPFFFC